MSFPALAAERSARPVQLAQADGTAADGTATDAVVDPVALAEKAVEEARAALRAALASGNGVDEARANLRTALEALDAARKAAGQPPLQPTEQPPPAQEEAPPAAEQPPAPAEEDDLPGLRKSSPPAPGRGCSRRRPRFRR